MNFLKFLSLFLVNTAEDIKVRLVQEEKEAEESLTHTKRILVAALISAVAALVLGLLIGYAGWQLESETVESAARFFIGLGGVLTSLLFLWFWTRAAVAATLLMYLSRTGRLLGSKFLELSQEQIDGFLNWLRGILLWLLLVYTVAVFLPVWRNLAYYGAFIILLTIGFFMVGAWNIKGNGLQKPMFAATVLAMSYLLFALAAPTIVARIGQIGNREIERLMDDGRPQTNTAQNQAAVSSSVSEADEPPPDTKRVDVRAPKTDVKAKSAAPDAAPVPVNSKKVPSYKELAQELAAEYPDL